jgi:hypothetical protein
MRCVTRTFRNDAHLTTFLIGRDGETWSAPLLSGRRLPRSTSRRPAYTKDDELKRRSPSAHRHHFRQAPELDLGLIVWFENDPRSPSQKLVPFSVFWGTRKGLHFRARTVVRKNDLLRITYQRLEEQMAADSLVPEGHAQHGHPHARGHELAG